MNIAIILAGGLGTRLVIENKPKQFLKLSGKEIIVHTIERFHNNNNIDKLLIVMNSDWIYFTEKLLQEYNITKILDIIPGGRSRQESGYKALLYLKDHNISDDDIVLIHDAARPFITNDIIDKVINVLHIYDACCVAVKATDTIISINDRIMTVDAVLDRSKLYHQQTPQAFRFSVIFDAHQHYKNDLDNNTDDASLLYKLGKEIHIIEGNYNNIKITSVKDLILAQQIINEYF